MDSRKAPRVAAYLRISKADSASTSIEKQRDNITRLVASRWPDASLVEFVDEGFSATKTKTRPAFARLSERLADFDFVVFDRQDRVARKPLDFWTFAASAERHDTKVIGASEDLDLSTADGEMTAGIRLTVARAEARRTADRIKATNVYRQRTGVRAIGGPVTFGLRRDPDNRDRFQPCPTRGPLVADAVQRVISGQANVNSITHEWTAQGIPTARGGDTWSTRAVAKILRSPSLAGMVVTRGDVIRGDDGLPIVRPEEGLVDLATWHKLQDVLDARADGHRGTPKGFGREAPLLAGLLFDVQGRPMYSHRIKNRKALYTSRGNDGASVVMDRIEEFVRDAVLDRFGRYQEVEERIVQAAQDPERLASVRASIAQTLASMADPSADVVELAGRLQSQRKAEAEILASGAEEVVEFVPTGRTIREAYEEAPDTAARNLILSGPLVSVVVGPGIRGGGNQRPLGDRITLNWRR